MCGVLVWGVEVLVFGVVERSMWFAVCVCVCVCVCVGGWVGGCVGVCMCVYI